MTAEKPREIAARLLTDPSGTYIETRLDRALERTRLKPEDRGFLQELVYGVVRWELTLDWLIQQKTGGRPQKPIVQNLLRLALYQLFWLDRVPSYAAVNETVEICKRNGFVPQGRFVNAVLRSYTREAEQTRELLNKLRQTDPALGFSHPDWLCRRWEERYGKANALRLLDWNNSPPPTFARVNTLKTTAADLLLAWQNEGVVCEETSFPWVPPGTILKLVKHPPLSGLRSFMDGLFYVQDPSTLLAVEMLAPGAGESILDLCAAPGGKTTYIAQKMRNEGRVVAEDLDPERLKLVVANADRLGAPCVGTGVQDGPFDRVLVDAPCSNTGVMRRRVELRWRIKPEEIQRLAITQLELLKTAAKRCRAGGTIVYSTCSLEPEENGAVVREFLAAQPGYRLEEERELSPMENGTDGAYCARIRAAELTE